MSIHYSGIHTATAIVIISFHHKFQEKVGEGCISGINNYTSHRFQWGSGPITVLELSNLLSLASYKEINYFDKSYIQRHS